MAQADGEVIITNDGATILNKMKVEQPAAKMLVDLAKSQVGAACFSHSLVSTVNSSGRDAGGAGQVAGGCCLCVCHSAMPMVSMVSSRRPRCWWARPSGKQRVLLLTCFPGMTSC